MVLSKGFAARGPLPAVSLCLWWSGVSARGGRPPAMEGRRNGHGRRPRRSAQLSTPGLALEPRRLAGDSRRQRRASHPQTERRARKSPSCSSGCPLVTRSDRPRRRLLVLGVQLVTNIMRILQKDGLYGFLPLDAFDQNFGRTGPLHPGLALGLELLGVGRLGIGLTCERSATSSGWAFAANTRVNRSRMRR